MNFWKLLLRFVPKYKWNIIWYIVLNVLSSVFCIFSFAAVIPLIQIIFGLSDPNINYVELSKISSFSSALDVLKNNTLFLLQEKIEVYGATTGLLLVGVFLVCTSALTNLTSYFAYYVRIPIRTGIARDLRKDVYYKILNMPLGKLQYEKKGDYVSRMTSDVEEVDYGIGTALDMLIRDPIQIVVYLTTMFGVSWMLSCEALALLIFCCILMIFISISMKRIAMKGQIQRGRILSYFEEAISHLPIIQSYNLENLLSGKFEVINNTARNIFNKSNRIFSIAYPLTDFLIITTIAVMLWCGGKYVLNGYTNIDASSFIYFLMIFYSIIPPIRDMIKASFGIRKAMASEERIDKILNVQIIEQDRQHPSLKEQVQRIKIGESLINFKDVTFDYDGDIDILRDFKLHIIKGEKVAITGAIGKGKTTLANLLLQLYRNKIGSIEIAGHQITNLNLQELRETIAYVAQNPYLFNDTIMYNIWVGDTCSTEDKQMYAASLAQLTPIIDILPQGINTIIGDDGKNLSRGQQQCIAMARAILKDAPIYILDEATSAMDKATQQQILSTLKQLWQNKTVIFISHDENILSFADRIIRMN